MTEGAFVERRDETNLSSEFLFEGPGLNTGDETVAVQATREHRFWASLGRVGVARCNEGGEKEGER